MARSPRRKKDGPNPTGRSFVIAVDRKTGQTRWETETKTHFAGYATPCVYEADGGRAELIFANTDQGIMGVDPATGKIDWEFGQPFRDRAISSPVTAPGLVLAAHGANVSGRALPGRSARHARPGHPAQPSLCDH